jgi:site-specific recombinase XerD
VGEQQLRSEITAPLERRDVEFLLDRQAKGVSLRTIEYYEGHFRQFSKYLLSNQLTFSGITPTVLRAFLIERARTCSPWTVSGSYRAIKSLLLWYAKEYDEPHWANIIHKVAAPKVPNEKQDPVPAAHVATMVRVCSRKTFYGTRNRAILLTLYDTGVRVSELLALNIQDLDLRNGALYVAHGKGDKSRTAAAGARTRQAIISWLRHRPDARPQDPLFCSRQGERLTYSGIRDLVENTARQARVPRPKIHAFRRAWALELLRNGVNIYALQALGGWADLSIIQRYLKQSAVDLLDAHAAASPGDALK